jgi:hypothetical protein
MGTEEDVKEHEIKCEENYDRRSCYTCKYKELHCRNNIEEKSTTWIYKCKLGKEIPEGKIFEFCPSYDRKEKPESIFGDIFSNALFGSWR